MKRKDLKHSMKQRIKEDIFRTYVFILNSNKKKKSKRTKNKINAEKKIKTN